MDASPLDHPGRQQSTHSDVHTTIGANFNHVNTAPGGTRSTGSSVLLSWWLIASTPSIPVGNSDATVTMGRFGVECKSAPIVRWEGDGGTP
eukprot:m.47142 g.47142  ORF g.47142 m.47142 type:complete len:91 (+) comp6851_c0_seq1:627-899(+)